MDEPLEEGITELTDENDDMDEGEEMEKPVLGGSALTIPSPLLWNLGKTILLSSSSMGAVSSS